MSKLLIVESPAKAKTISKYLDNKYTVRASIGHIRDLPKSNAKAIDIAAGFIPHYEITEGKEKVVRELKKAAKSADEIVLATDPDREGEAIAWHLTQALGLADEEVKRIVFHEITKDAVQEAMEHPRGIDGNLRKAQEARRVLDRLVGYDLSGLIWKKVRYGLSAGRVQSPALRILVEREREIRAFKPEDYWVITADVKGHENTPFTLTCSEEAKSKERAKEIIDLGKKGPWVVDSVKESEMKRAARAPFTTSTLQQAASSRLGLSPSRTMSIAQKLYENGHITYMRTDSVIISASAKKHILSHVEKSFGKEFAKARSYRTKSKSAQEAHEAIRPTSIEKETVGGTDEQKKLYRLIWQRALASQMADARVLRTKITAKVGGSEPDFFINGSRVVFPGWLVADPEARGEDVELPKVAEKEKLTLIKMHSEEKQTQPPPRYSEAGLVKELEKRGIGRPSTYATIIKTLGDRRYVEKEGRALKPTDTGEVVSTFLENNFKKYISDSFTAEMEDELDEIARGERTYEKTLKDFYEPFSKSVKDKEKIEKLTNLGDAPDEHECPKCGSSMVIKLGKSGKFFSCSRFPECDGALRINGDKVEEPKKTGEKCPECGEELVERDGKYGKFVACSNYPKCKYVKRDGNGNSGTGTGVKCPICKNGEMVEKRGRYGTFYSCSNYPKCKHAIKSKPTGDICKECGSLMMEGTKTIPERCSNKECPNHNPHKLKK